MDSVSSDQDDNWSRQVETDHAHEQSSEFDETAATSEDVADAAPKGPLRIEPTLKEKLVERERQRRVESIQGQLKRQFALQESVTEGDEEVFDSDGDGHSRENGSAAGTVGEGSIVAPVETLVEDDQNKTINYPMERFLREQTIVEEDTGRENLPISSKRDSSNQGVLMERFLQAPVVVVETSEGRENVESPAQMNRERTVSFEVDRSQTLHDAGHTSNGESIPVDVATPLRSLDPKQDNVQNGTEQSIPDEVTTPLHAPDSTCDDFETTEASRDSDTRGREGSFLAFASMDCLPADDTDPNNLLDIATPVEQGGAFLANASLDCMPPSDSTHNRELTGVETPDISGNRSNDDANRPPSVDLVDESPSIDEPRVLGLTQAEIEELAAIEEVSQQNAPPSERDDLSASSFVAELVSDFGGPGMDQGATLSQGTPTTAMESASIQSVRASEPIDDPSVDEGSENASVSSHPMSHGENVSVRANPPSEMGDAMVLTPVPGLPASLDGTDHRHSPVDDLAEMAALSQGVVNRRIRPGMAPVGQVERRDETNAGFLRKAMSAPDSMHINVDGFDYDKDIPSTPVESNFRGDAMDPWSPGSRLSIEQSPFQPRNTLQPRFQEAPDILPQGTGENPQTFGAEMRSPSVPIEIVTDAKNAVNEEARKEDAREYSKKTIIQRALSGRAIALGVSFLVELTVLSLIKGNGDSLSASLGQAKFYMMMGFLPLCSAMAGNVGLQASSFTSRALSTGEITMKDYRDFVVQETGSAVCLGLGFGIIAGLLALYLSNWDLLFALPIMVGQTASITAAGLTGALSPLTLSLLPSGMAENWKGLLETTMLDVVAAFTMVVLTVKTLYFVGPLSVEPMDTCFVASA